MPSFGQKSATNLATCDPKIIAIFEEVVKKFDCSVIFGHRGQELQDKFFHDGTSQRKWPDSKHNTLPSRAIDAVPYPEGYGNIDKFFEFATYVFAEANRQGVKLVWGGHWRSFKDYAHWELAPDE